jgi:magnesium chelatase subunit I
VRTRAEHVVPRISDLTYLPAGSRGKLELNMTEEAGQEDKVILRLVEEAVKNVFDLHFKPGAFKNVVEFFEAGTTLETGDAVAAPELLERLAGVRDFSKQLAARGRELEPALADGPSAAELAASLAEFILEGLHCHNRVNKRGKSGGTTYGL